MTSPQDENQPGQFPSFPADDGTPSAGSAPRQVVIGFWLYIAAAALSLISLIIALSALGNSRASLQDQLAAQGQQVSDSILDAIISGVIVLNVVFAVVWVVLFVLFAYFMKRGANWARIALTVVTVLSIVNVLSGYGAGALQVVLAVIATILIWLRPASDYFIAVKGRTAAPQVY